MYHKLINKYIHILKSTIIVLLFFFITSVFSEQVFANTDFISSYNTRYEVDQTGKTIVTNNITLVNKESKFYPKQYSITIDTTKIENIIAKDDSGLLTPQVVQQNDTTTITVFPNNPGVGKGAKTSFTLRYEDYNITKPHGDIWEIQIPGLSTIENIDEYLATLIVHPNLGKNAYMTPLPFDGIHFNKEQLSRGGINAAYGDGITYNIDLDYHIKNSSLKNTSVSLPLPPETAYQTVTIKSITPKPSNVTKDADGNTLAHFDLDTFQSYDVHATIQVHTHAFVKQNVSLTTEEYQLYTRALPYWEADNQIIESLSKELKTAQDIYDFVIQLLTYDSDYLTSKPTRMGALEALSKKENVICSEFTDLFIAISRAAGIPARRVVGYAYTTDKTLKPLSLITDLLHTWPEYYDRDSQSWISIDPTWASTTGGLNYFDKLDFFHVAFSIQGVSSSEPNPAGYYKKITKIPLIYR